MTTLTTKQRALLNGLRLASKPNTVEMFREHFGDELLQGLVGKDYVYIDNNEVVISLQGVRALLDFEGIKV